MYNAQAIFCSIIENKKFLKAKSLKPVDKQLATLTCGKLPMPF
ncbi:hypothetical protein NIES4102_34620 [Chondrocystis sp. NIES-4102]|nr:hypothetical protein NIES4102_34620 [Chondrocystis sp. NIES-4102]